MRRISEMPSVKALGALLVIFAIYAAYGGFMYLIAGPLASTIGEGNALGVGLGLVALGVYIGLYREFKGLEK